MHEIIYINRLTGKKEKEKVYGFRLLELFYGKGILQSILRAIILPFIVKWPFVSSLYGYFQKKTASAKKILPFIKEYDVDASEFLEPVSNFKSFNDFFIRKLKPDARPIVPGESIAVIPADGRYYFYQDVGIQDSFIVKGSKLNLTFLLQDEALASHYQEGSLLIGRLCPSDYHRFHFPCDCLPDEATFINGWLYSVNPIAIKRNIEIFTQNKRTRCRLQTDRFGEVIYMEIGATNVGSIHETYIPYTRQQKGNEKGYFEFGASALILLFKKGMIQFDRDLLEATQSGYEIRCLMGQRMGSSG